MQMFQKYQSWNEFLRIQKERFTEVILNPCQPGIVIGNDGTAVRIILPVKS